MSAKTSHCQASKPLKSLYSLAARQFAGCHGGFGWWPLVVFFYIGMSVGHAATIGWGVPMTISGDADVITTGTNVGAYYEGGGGTNLIINGVTFTNEGGTTIWGNVSFAGSGTFAYATNTLGNNVAPFASLSAAYSNVLSGGIWIKGGAPVTVTLTNLTVGHQYLVQFWANDSRFPGVQTNRYDTLSGIWTGGNLFFNTTHVAGGVGQYVIGTFVADAASQAFVVTGGNLTSGGSPDAQTEAIQVRDNGVYTYTPARINLAKYQPVITDSTNGTQSAAYLTDGFVDSDSCWVSGNTGPHWAQVGFPFPVTVGSAHLVMGQNNSSPLTIFSLQYLTNGTWMSVPGSSVVGNTNLERNLVLSSPITASAFRVYDSLDSPIRIRQFALYPPNGTNGYPFGTDFAIDLARKQPAFATANTAGNWPLLAADGLVSPSSAWETTLIGSNSLLINLQFTNKIGSAHLYSGATGVAPLTNFGLQYWTGSAWANIPGGSVSGNTNAALVIPFTTPVTTSKVQLVFTNSGTSAVQELCIFPANNNGGYPLGTGIVANPPVTAKYDTYSDSYYYLSNSLSSLVIIESNGLPVTGPSSATNLAGQYQVLLNYDNGTYRLINRNSGLCLAGAQLTTNVGAALMEEVYSALPDQEWYLQTLDGINFYLINQFSGLAADAQGGALIQNVQTNSASQFWQISLAQIFPKKGIAGSWGGYPITFDANWTYGWWYGPNPNLPGVNYYPMDPDTWYRGNTVAGNLWTLQPGWRTAGYSLNVMGFNEPDQVGQADIDATNGAIYWMNDQNLDLPLAGPAAANVNGTWNQIFYGYITNWGCRVDYLPAHEYVSPNSGSSSCWVSPLQTAYSTYGIPMWMTEFGNVDWSGNQSWSEEDNYTALAEFMWRAESLTWVRKYSLFIFAGALAPNPWTKTTPAPTSNAYDINGVLSPLGELYAAWDDDANVETNKAYYIYNSSTRKRLSNSPGLSSPNAQSILVRDGSTQWTLVSAGSSNLYYLVSVADGRQLSYNGSVLSLVAPGTTGTAVQWSLASYQYGWYYLQHPATGKELSLAYNNSTFTASYSMVTNTTTGTAVQWRFIVPYTPVPVVWTGGTNASWVAANNWNSPNANPNLNHTGNYAVTFNNLSTSNLATVLNFSNNPTVSNGFSAFSIVVSNPPGPVSIGATNLLGIATGIDLSGASQNLTITAPLYIGVAEGGAGTQLWNVTNNRTLSVNGGVTGVAPLVIAGGGMVSLGGAATYAGDTTVSAGSTLQMGKANVLPNGSGVGNMYLFGLLNLNSNSESINALNGSGTVDNAGGGAATLTLGNNNASNTNFVGNIQNSGGSLALVKNGTGGLTLTGTNTYGGDTTINSGSIYPGNGSAIGAGTLIINGGATFYPVATLTFSNPVTLSGGTLEVGGAASHTATYGGTINITSNSTIYCDGGTYGNYLDGPINLGSGNCTLTLAGGGTANTLNGGVSGTSGTILVAANATAYLQASNTFAGFIQPQAGNLSLGNAYALQNATLNLATGDTGTANLNNLSAVIGALTGSRNLVLGSGIIAIGKNNSSTTYSGAMSGGGSLNKIGGGTLILAGANTYASSTTISSGTLALSGSGAIASTNIIVAGGASLDVSGLSTTFNLGGITLANGSVGAVISGNNNCSAGTLSLVTDGINPAFIQTNGTMTIAASTVIKVNNLGAVLANGHYPLIAAATAGNPGLVNGPLPAVVVTGNGAVGAAALQINGSGGLDLVVGPPPKVFISSVNLSGGSLILQGTNGASLGTYSILTSTNVAWPLSSWTTNATGSFTVAGTFSNAVPVGTQAQCFFLIKQP